MVELQTCNGLARLTLNHGKVNAMDLELLVELNETLDQLGHDRKIRGLILAGNPRVFSAGIDLKRLVAEPVDYLDRFLPQLSGLFVRALNFPRPLVVAVTGHAIAGGCVLACTGDYRVVSTQARIGIPEMRVGVPFPTAGLEIMRWATQPRFFRKMINTGATWTGEEAVSAGLADQACEPERLMETAHQAMAEIQTIPPAVFELTKRQTRFPVVRQIEAGDAEFDSEIQQRWRATETRQAVRQYVEQRLGQA